MSTIKLFLFPLLFISVKAFSQGAWSIGYRHVSTITQEHIGDTVRIDFNDGKGTADTSKWIRAFISRKDTGRFVVDGKEMKLLERQPIYPDMGEYHKQYLEWLNHTSKHRMIIEDFIIKAVTPDSLQLAFSICSYEMKQKGHAFRRILLKCTPYTVWIARDRLSGLMYYNSH